MQLGKSILLAASALTVFGAAGGALADSPEERGIVPSVIPAAPDESGRVNNVPEWHTLPAQPGPASAAPAYERGSREVGAYFARYDVNRDGVISRDEAQQDPDLARVFARADANHDGVLDPAEFQQAAVLAVNERRHGAAYGSGS